MKRLIKTVLSRVAPELYTTLASIRARRTGQRLEREWGYADLSRRVLAEHGPVVSSGPFRGLRFTPRTYERHISPKLYGSYEAPLHPALERALGKRYGQVLDVGCADGYYAVGLARRMAATPVHAFDTDPWARATVREMSAANEVSNLHVHGPCSPGWLARHLRPHAFILSDCEGYEDILFDPERTPALRSADLLIELHDQIIPGITGRLLERFGATHHAELIDDRPRTPAEFPAVGRLPEADRLRALHEVRPEGQRWLFLVAKG